MISLCNLLLNCISTFANFSIYQWCAVACCCSKLKDCCTATGAKISNCCTTTKTNIKTSYNDCTDNCFQTQDLEHPGEAPHVELAGVHYVDSNSGGAYA